MRTVHTGTLGFLSAVSFILSTLLPTQAQANVVMDLTIAEMSTLATAVVHGRVLSVEASWNDERTRIFTEVEIQVISYLAGSGPEVIRIRQAGGRVGDTELLIAGQPRFNVGDQVVTFLEPDGSDVPNRFIVLAMALGFFKANFDRLTGEIVLHRDLSNLTRVPGPGRTSLVRNRIVRPLLLRELTDQVRQAVQRGGVR